METERLVRRRYRIGELLGQGAMGSVFRGFDEVTRTPVALKLLKSSQLRESADEVERFRREGEALALLNHPGIVRLLDMFEDDHRHYLVMELVEGGSLEAVLRLAPKPPLEWVLRLGLELADALSRAHHVGIIHRDIKPANILLAPDGSARLSDFGVALIAGKERLSGSQAVVGTLDYLSPETIQGEAADARCDVWALGVVLYELVAGATPFRAEHAGGTLHAILTTPTPDLEALRPDCPTELMDLVYRMLEKQRDRRIPGAREVGAELERIQRQLGSCTSDAPGARPDRASARNPPTNRPGGRFDESAYAATVGGVRMPAPASTLPAASTPFFGREHEMARLAHLLRDPTVRLVTILGPGGMGKTRFAVEAARRLAEGSAEFAATAATASPELDVTLVELASLAGPEFVLPAIAEALGFRFYPGGDPKAQLLAYLRRRRLLLLLDNFEHVLGAGTLVSDILEAAPGARALVTSRERLNLSGESVLALTGMAYPEAGARERSSDFSSVRLFLASARRVNSELEVDEENERAAARICRAVQGLPLGIVLAASWSSTLSLREIADEVARSFAFLSAEVRDVPARQHSLRAVFEYSFELLEPEERVVFARLAVFRGGFTRAAAERVAGATLKTLAALVNKSLITREPKTGRYWVHELLRQYAESQCQSSPTEYEQVRDRHASHFVELLERLTPDLRGVAPDVAAAAIDTELDNVRATWTHLLERQDLAGISKALEALALFYRLRSAFIEADSAFGAAVTRLAQPMPERGSASSRVLARSLGLKAHAAMSLWRNAEALEVAAQALALLDETAEPLLSGQALLVWAVASLWEGRVEQGLEAADRAASLYRRAGEAWETAQALLLLGRCRDWLGRAKAEALVREAIALQRSLPGGQVSGASLHDLGDVMAERGNYAEGCRLMREGLALVEDHGSLFDRHLCLLHLASAERKCGEYEAAEEHARGSVRLAREAFPFAETWALGVLGDVLKDRGRVDEATHCYQACLASGETLPRALALVNLGALALQRGEPEAEAMLLQGLGEFERHGTAWGIVAACDYLGHSACSSGRIETARAYFRRGLRQAVSEDLMPLAFNHLIGFARATALDGNLERAVELLSLVEQNAISERSALDNELKPLLAELSARLPTAHFGAAMARGQTLELAATLRELSA